MAAKAPTVSSATCSLSVAALISAAGRANTSSSARAALFYLIDGIIEVGENPLTINVFDRGHTVTIEDRYHHGTLRTRGTTVTVEDHHHTVTVKDRGHTVEEN